MGTRLFDLAPPEEKDRVTVGRKHPEDERLRKWMEWYDRQVLKREKLTRQSVPPVGLDSLAREEIEALYLERIRAGWAAPHRRKHQSVQGYRDIVVSLLLERDGRTCGICQKEILAGEETIDHIVQKSEGGADAAANVRLACRICNIRRPRAKMEPRLRGASLHLAVATAKANRS